MPKSLVAPWLRPTSRVERVLQDAQEHARQGGHDLPHSGHLLRALVQEPDSFSALLLGRLGVSPAQVRAEIARVEAEAPVPWSDPAPAPPPSRRRRRIETPPTELAWAENRAQTLDSGRQEAQALGDAYVGTEHLLLALIQAGGISGEVLRHLGVTGDRTRAALSDLKAVNTS